MLYVYCIRLRYVYSVYVSQGGVRFNDLCGGKLEESLAKQRAIYSLLVVLAIASKARRASELSRFRFISTVLLLRTCHVCFARFFSSRTREGVLNSRLAERA